MEKQGFGGLSWILVHSQVVPKIAETLTSNFESFLCITVSEHVLTNTYNIINIIRFEMCQYCAAISFVDIRYTKGLNNSKHDIVSQV